MTIRKEHAFVGDGLSVHCDKCGEPVWLHRKPRDRSARIDTRKNRIRPDRDFLRLLTHKPREFFGIDGEGVGRKNHLYTLLAVANSEATQYHYIENSDGLSTQDCLEFLYDLPEHVKLFGYSLGYDLTKMLEDVDDEILWKLWRPERRQRFGKDAVRGPRSETWNGWELNMQGTKFSFKKAGKSHKTRVIWDIWKFYQSKFTSACEDWKVGSKDDIARMQRMKDKRSELDKETPEAIKAYNKKELQFMADLAIRLTEAHTQAGLTLKSYYGAGSTAAAILKLLEIDKYIAKGPSEMQSAVAQGFFGGRFDNAYIGEVAGPVYSYDISSAYPYQVTHLPCLVHGNWNLTTDRAFLKGASAALVHYRLKPSVNTNRNQHWGPFPFRDVDGSISYPAESPGGWVWRDEFLAGEKYFDGVEFIEAWVYNCTCSEQPFKDIPNYYIERCRIGKEGPGIVLKLGCNSVYGKLAQSVGRGNFQSWIWAGIVTSGCRAQVLEAIGLHKDRANLLMIATDGIVTKERLILPKPMDTGTFNVWECQKHKKTCYECSDKLFKPLGGWEEKIVERGIFLARPGIYFPIEPSEKDIKTVRARGVGRSVIVENHKAIVQAWKSWNGKLCSACNGVGGKCKLCNGSGGWPQVAVSNVGRFCGAKTCISRRVIKDPVTGKPHFEYHRADGDHMKGQPKLGQWITREVSMSFNPFPKRDGLTSEGYLRTRRFTGERESLGYSKARVSDEARQLAAERDTLSEQPTGDYTDY